MEILSHFHIGSFSKMESNVKIENDIAELECICGDDLNYVFQCPTCNIPLSKMLEIFIEQQQKKEVKIEQESSTNHN